MGSKRSGPAAVAVTGGVTRQATVKMCHGGEICRSAGPYARRNARQRLGGLAVGRVAIITDSGSDFDPAKAASLGVSIVPLLVSFGNDTYEAGLNLSTDEFWTKMTAPDAPFPKTAACSPGSFQTIFQKAFDEGAESIVSVHVADTLSGDDQVGPGRARDLPRPRHRDRRFWGLPRWARASSWRWGSRWPTPARRRRTSPRPAPASQRVPDLPCARDARVPEAWRQDQRRTGRDRHAAVGQADHRGQGRRSRAG